MWLLLCVIIGGCAVAGLPSGLSELEDMLLPLPGDDTNCNFEAPTTSLKDNQHPPNKYGSGDWNSLDQVIMSMMSCRGVPGMAIAVTQNGNVVYKRGYGYRFSNRTEPVSTDTIFGIGSTTKAFTAVLLELLEQQGKLKWDTPISELTNFKYEDDNVIQQNTNFIDLMAHRTGISRTDELWASEVPGHTTKDQIDQSIRYIPLNHPFRTGQFYNNFAVSLAGNIGAKLADSTWESEVLNKIFKPLNMQATTTSTAAAIQSGKYAFPHGYNFITRRLEPYQPDVNKIIEKVCAAGCIVSSVDDLTKWTNFLLSGVNSEGKTIINKKSLNYMFQPQAQLNGPNFELFQMDKEHFPESLHLSTYCLGWLRGEYSGNTFLFHTGGTIGHVTFIALFPTQNVSVIVLSNSDTLGFTPMAAVMAAFDITQGKLPWVNATTTCSWPCPWSPSCDNTLNYPLKCPAKTVENRANRALRKFLRRIEENLKERTNNSNRQPRSFEDYFGNYSNPGYGTYTIYNSSSGIGSLYGNQKCDLFMEYGDSFLFNCSAPYYLGYLNREVYFTRGVEGFVTAVHLPDYDYAIPPITFTKSDYSPQLYSFPRYRPEIPYQP